MYYKVTRNFAPSIPYIFLLDYRRKVREFCKWAIVFAGKLKVRHLLEVFRDAKCQLKGLILKPLWTIEFALFPSFSFLENTLAPISKNRALFYIDSGHDIPTI